MSVSLFCAVRPLMLRLTLVGGLALTSLTCAQSPSEGKRFSGKVLQTTNAASYTYVEVDTGKEKVWAAAPLTPVKVGDQVSFDSGMPMQKFVSKALNRTFETIYFVGKLESPGTPTTAQGSASSLGQMPRDAIHGGLAPSTPAGAVTTSFAGIEKPAGGYTVAEIYAQKASLAKKSVLFRGKVVKYNAQILKKNWLHVQDGTGAAGAQDLTVTTAKTARVGDIVLVKGKLALDRDFGSGYRYGVIVEDAEVTVEPAK